MQNAIIPSWLNTKADAELPPGLRVTITDFRPVFIYALVDPRTSDIRYIGKSIRPEQRLENHINENPKRPCHRTNWLRELKSAGLRPILCIIEEIQGLWPWQHAERFWIAYGRKQGWPLTNSTSGGDGVSDLPPESRERIKRTWIGRKHSEETKRKIGESASKRRHSAATRARMSKARKGRIITWGRKLSEANAKLTASQVSEIIRRANSGDPLKDLAIEFGVHRDTIRNVLKGNYIPRPEQNQ